MLISLAQLTELFIRNAMLFERNVGDVERNNCYGMNAYCMASYYSRNLLFAVRSQLREPVNKSNN